MPSRTPLFPSPPTRKPMKDVRPIDDDLCKKRTNRNSFFDLLPEEKAELLLVEDEEEKK
jgi:hypothetical protein